MSKFLSWWKRLSNLLGLSPWLAVISLCDSDWQLYCPLLWSASCWQPPTERKCSSPGKDPKPLFKKNRREWQWAVAINPQGHSVCVFPSLRLSPHEFSCSVMPWHLERTAVIYWVPLGDFIWRLLFNQLILSVSKKETSWKSRDTKKWNIIMYWGYPAAVVLGVELRISIPTFHVWRFLDSPGPRKGYLRILSCREVL